MRVRNAWLVSFALLPIIAVTLAGGALKFKGSDDSVH
jgi:hypothetical protein